MMPLAAKKSIWDLIEQSQWAGFGLVIALLACAWVVYRLRAWFGDSADHSDGNQELLTHLRQLKGEGQVTDEEFRNIKGRLFERMEQSSGPPPTRKPATSDPTSPRDGPSATSGD